MTELWNAPSSASPLTHTVRIPGSKSLTNRWYILAALANGTSTIRHPLIARDTELMRQAITKLGVTVDSTPDGFDITPGAFSGHTEIDCGLAGTVMRFVPPISLLASGPIRFDGDPHARVRPMRTIIDSLRQLGVTVNDDDRGTLPFTVEATGSVNVDHVTIDASASSQFVSALLLAGARFDNGLTITHTGDSVPSLPHIEMTIETLNRAGVQVTTSTVDGQIQWNVPAGEIHAFDVTVEPDLSNAAPFLAAAVVTGGSVTVPNWPSETNQAGDALRHLLPLFGATVTKDGDDLTVSGSGSITGIDVDLHDVGELTPVIAAICALASTPSRIRGVAHLRGHETDRLAALATELNNLGGNVEETEDGLSITPAPLHAGVMKTYDDHRMAMAAAVLGLAIDGLQVENVGTTAKTLPEFADMWSAMVNA